ncbi:hypothetical protein HELRODRAFT_183242 [Helobdella robusta]|uniref:MANSC domain-containing protein n=1 Tax=Helobdella robusta TaxID=6412 RepID=T1FJC9_HELRO|nr:hypothetical protein HELRODRAFT_183242 [Helobdella robusta]ESO11362.1 hypothetical protein HELRODRAFT_183242 [Helobdella robusta]
MSTRMATCADITYDALTGLYTLCMLMTCLIEKSLKGQIIKTNVSLEAGAHFIESLHLQTAAECQEKCCEHAEPCNTAVIRVKNYKPGVSCYLFDCKSPSVCSFDTHSDFKVIQLSSSSSSVQEHQLDELASTSQQDNRHSHASTSPTSPTNVQCFPGFHPVAGSCRKDCQKLSFECLNVDQPSLSQCIALYDKCDTFNQCDDGSDEVACSYDQQQDHRNDAAAGGGAGEKDDNGSHHTAGEIVFVGKV